MHTTPRNAMGRFLPGHSGNPAGRPPASASLRAAARCHTGAAIAIVATLLNDETAPLRTRFAAARALLQAAGPLPAPETRAERRERRIRDAMRAQGAQAMERLLRGQMPFRG